MADTKPNVKGTRTPTTSAQEIQKMQNARDSRNSSSWSQNYGKNSSSQSKKNISAQKKKRAMGIYDDRDWSSATITHNGKNYTMSWEEYKGIQDLYKQTWNDYYEQDDEDQWNKRNGVMPRSFANGYNKNDKSLYDLGLPAGKYFESYLETYRSAKAEQQQIEAEYKAKNTRLNEFYKAIGDTWLNDEITIGSYNPTQQLDITDGMGTPTGETELWNERRQKQFFDLLDRPEWADVRQMYDYSRKKAKAPTDYESIQEYYEARYEADAKNRAAYAKQDTADAKEFATGKKGTDKTLAAIVGEDIEESERASIYSVGFTYDDFDRVYNDQLRSFFMKQKYVDDVGKEFTVQDYMTALDSQNEVSKAVLQGAKAYVDSYQGDYIDMMKTLKSGNATDSFQTDVKIAVLDKIKNDYKGNERKEKKKEFLDAYNVLSAEERAAEAEGKLPEVDKWLEDATGIGEWSSGKKTKVGSLDNIFNRMREEGYTDKEIAKARRHMMSDSRYAWQAQKINEEYYQNFEGGLNHYAKAIANGYDIDEKTSSLSDAEVLAEIADLADVNITEQVMQETLAKLRSQNVSAPVVRKAINQFLVGEDRRITTSDKQVLRKSLNEFADLYENDERGAIIEIARSNMLQNGYKNFDIDQAFSAAGWGDAIPIERRAMDFFVAYDYGQTVMSGDNEEEAIRFYNLSEDEREAVSLDAWASMTPEERNAYIDRFDMEKDFNPILNKSYSEQITQQFVGAWAKVAVGMITSAANLGDMVSQWNDALTRQRTAEFISQVDGERYEDVIAQRQERRERRQASIDELRKTNAAIQMYGKAQGQDGISNLISIGSDVMSEIMRMQTMNFIGGGLANTVLKIGGSVTNGASIGRGLSRLAKVSSSMPFVSDAIGNYWGEAMQEEGVSVGDATAYALICGTLEGAVEAINAERIFNRLLGGQRLADKLLRSGKVAMSGNFRTKCKLIGFAANALGEGGEEGVSHLASLLLGNITIRKNNKQKFDFGSFLSDVGMGALIGVVADAFSGGADNYSPETIICEKMLRGKITPNEAEILNGLEIISSLTTRERNDYVSHSRPEFLLSDSARNEQLEIFRNAATNKKAAYDQFESTVKNHQDVIDAAQKKVNDLIVERGKAEKSRSKNKAKKLADVSAKYEVANAELVKAQSEFNNGYPKWIATLNSQITSFDGQINSSSDAITRHWVAFDSAMEKCKQAISARKRGTDEINEIYARYIRAQALYDVKYPTIESQNDYVDAVASQADADENIAPAVANAEQDIQNGEVLGDAIRENGAEGAATVEQATVEQTAQTEAQAQEQAEQAEAPVEQTIAEQAPPVEEQSAEATTPVAEKPQTKRSTSRKKYFATPEAVMREGNVLNGRIELDDEMKNAVRRYAKYVFKRDVIFDVMPVGHNGLFDPEDGTIHLNVYQKNKAGASVVEVAKITFIHELTHSLEKTKSYGELDNLVMKAICLQNGIKESEFESKYVQKHYLEPYERAGKPMTMSLARREAIANFMERNALSEGEDGAVTTKQFADFVTKENSGLAGHIFNNISNMLKRIGNRAKGDAVKRLLQDSQKIWAKALKEADADMAESAKYAVDKNGASSVKYSVDRGDVDGRELYGIKSGIDVNGTDYSGIRGRPDDSQASRSNAEERVFGRNNSETRTQLLNDFFSKGTTKLSPLSLSVTEDHQYFSDSSSRASLDFSLYPCSRPCSCRSD